MTPFLILARSGKNMLIVDNLRNTRFAQELIEEAEKVGEQRG
jgi:predicted transposase YdaD